MFWQVFLSAVISVGVAGSTSLDALREYNYKGNYEKKSNSGARHTLEDNYEGNYTGQTMKKEIEELKRMFKANSDEVQSEMIKIKEAFDRQQEKVLEMEAEISDLKRTVNNQDKMIKDLKAVEKVLKHEMYRQEIELNSAKDKTGQTTNMISDHKQTVETMVEYLPLQLINKSIETVQKMRNERLQKSLNIYGEKPGRRSGKMGSYKDRSLPKMRLARDGLTERGINGEIAFSAYLSHVIPHLSHGHTIKFDQIILNDGNGYNQYSGVFTVPRSGVYLLTFTFDVYDNWQSTGLKLVVNNRNVVDGIAESNGNKHSMAGNTVIIRLARGEVVRLEAYYSADGEIVSTSTSKLATFSGVLLY